MNIQIATPPEPRNLHEKICAAQQKQKDAKRRAQSGFPVETVIMEMWEWE